MEGFTHPMSLQVASITAMLERLDNQNMTVAELRNHLRKLDPQSIAADAMDTLNK